MITPLKDLRPFKTSWRIQVKIIHAYKQYSLKSGETIELIIADESDAKMSATVRKEHVKKFERCLVVGSWKIITTMTLNPVTGNYRVSDLMYKIAFLYNTTTKEAAFEQLKSICQDIVPGKANFEEVAHRVSDCNSAKRGGLNIVFVLFQRVPNLIGGSFVDSQPTSYIDVINHATQEVVSKVPLTTNEEFKAAVSAAKHAFPLWRNTPITTRQRVMLKFQELIGKNMDKLAMNITTEQGKTLKDSHGDIFRGLEVVEHACGMATLQMGEYVPNVSNGVDTYSIREPLGVCAGICPFNFPAMIPLWDANIPFNISAPYGFVYQCVSLNLCDFLL